MNRVAPNNPVVAPVADGDDLDALLRSFYRAEMPPEWPPFRAAHRRGAPAPPLSRRGGRRRFFTFGSRAALAASVALLLLGAYLVPRSSGPPGDPGPYLRVGEGDASRQKGGSPLPSLKDASGRDLLDLPDNDLFPPEQPPAPAGTRAAEKGDARKKRDKVKSSLHLEQKDGSGSIRITVEELPPGR